MNSVHQGILRFSREENEIYTVGYSIINGDPEIQNGFGALLSPEEIGERNGFKYARRRKSFVLGRASAKLAIEQISGETPPSVITIDKGVFGFPIVKGISERISVSISHCESIGISIAYPDEHPVSVDIEKIDEERVALIEQYMTSEEMDLSTKYCSSEIGAFLMWTAKESLSKILKTGLTLDFNVMSIKEIEEVSRGVYVSTFTNFPQYKSVTFQTKKMVFSMVSPEKSTFDLSSIIELKNQLVASEDRTDF
ncbi:MAG: 4'-phosphopantetheinyl transferase superfamily protein [Crocinitomicaceae bacterium]|nr:4'-phosphopantetheinyl transferase superfamily protein [Crocinitomicaceae bacterium]